MCLLEKVCGQSLLALIWNIFFPTSLLAHLLAFRTWSAEFIYFPSEALVDVLQCRRHIARQNTCSQRSDCIRSRPLLPSSAFCQRQTSLCYFWLWGEQWSILQLVRRMISSLQLLTHLYRQATNRYLSTFRPNQKPDNRGYGSYSEADEAWNFFKKTGVVPLAPIDGGVAASRLFGDQPVMTHHHASPSRSVEQGSSSHPSSSSPACHIPRVGLPATFYIVHAGYSPGVYNSL